MGCNQSKSEIQPLPITTNHHDNHYRIDNTAMAPHEIPKQNTIYYECILFQENQDDNYIEPYKRPTRKGQNNNFFEAQQQRGVVLKQGQEAIGIDRDQAIIEITNLQKLMEAIELQVQDNKLYTHIFDTSHLKEILQFIRKNNRNREYLYFSLSLLLKFMKNCNQVGKKQPILKIDSFQTIFFCLGYEWSKIEKYIYNQQKIYQRIRSLIIPSKTNQVTSHFNSYLDLRFERDFKQSEKLLEVLKQIIKQEPSCFCFYTNYLIKCCKNLQLQGKKSMEIEILLEEHCQSILTQIQNEFQALPQTDISKNQACKYHQNFKAKLQPDQKRFYEFDDKSSFSKEQQIQNYIKTLLEQAGSTYNQLLDFSVGFCNNQEYLMRPHVMDSDEQSIFQLKLSTFKDVQFQKYSPLQVQGESYSQFLLNQLQNLKKQRQSIYEFMTGKIEFKASCIFQIKHIFERVSLLNKCVDSIKQQILNKEYLLLQIKNNLNSAKGQKFMLIIFAINLYKIQIKLILDFNLSTFIIKDYIQSIIHSKMCSALTSLNLLNNNLTHQFMSRIYPFFQQIVNKSKQDRIKFQVPKQFEQLLMLWNVKFPIDSFESKNQQLNLKFVEKLKNIFLELKANRFTLKNQQKIYKLFNKIIFKSLQRQNFHSDLQFELFKAYINKEKSELKDNSNKETLNAIIYVYSKCLLNQAEKQYDRKDFIKAEEMAKQSQQLQLILSNQHILQSVKIRKILALCQYQKSNYNEALRLFTECIQIMRKIGGEQNKTLMLQIQKQMAIIFKQQGNSFKALNLFNDILRQIYAQEMKEQELQSAVLRNIADLLIKNSEYEESLVYLSKCLRVIQKYEGRNSIQSISTIVAIAQVYQVQGKYEEALLQYKKSELIIKLSKGESQFMLCDILKRMAKTYIELLLYKQAEEILIRCLNLTQRWKGINSSEYGDVSFIAGKLYLNLQNYQLALKYLLKALSINQKNKGKQTVESLDILKQITNTYKAMYKYKDEEHLMNKINNIISKENHKLNISHFHTYNNIAEKSQNRGNYVLALDYYEKSIHILDKLNKKKSIQAVQIHQSIANIYREQQYFSAAFQHYQKSLQLLQGIKGKDSVQGAQVICEIGRLNELEGRSDCALDYYLKCYNLCLRYKVKYRVYAMCCYRLGQLHLGRGQKKETSKYWKQCLPLFEKMLAKQADQIKAKLNELQNNQGLREI